MKAVGHVSQRLRLGEPELVVALDPGSQVGVRGELTRPVGR
jgi:hypothetical protein